MHSHAEYGNEENPHQVRRLQFSNPGRTSPSTPLFVGYRVYTSQITPLNPPEDWGETGI